MAYDTSRRLSSRSSNVAVKGLSRDLSTVLWVLPARPRTNHSPWNCRRLGVVEPRSPQGPSPGNGSGWAHPAPVGRTPWVWQGVVILAHGWLL